MAYAKIVKKKNKFRLLKITPSYVLFILMRLKMLFGELLSKSAEATSFI